MLKKVLGIVKNPAWGKLKPNWEGPYRITSVAGIDAYYLENLDENVVPRPCNVNNLKMYYYYFEYQTELWSYLAPWAIYLE